MCPISGAFQGPEVALGYAEVSALLCLSLQFIDCICARARVCVCARGDGRCVRGSMCARACNSPISPLISPQRLAAGRSRRGRRDGGRGGGEGVAYAGGPGLGGGAGWGVGGEVGGATLAQLRHITRPDRCLRARVCAYVCARARRVPRGRSALLWRRRLSWLQLL